MNLGEILKGRGTASNSKAVSLAHPHQQHDTQSLWVLSAHIRMSPSPLKNFPHQHSSEEPQKIKSVTNLSMIAIQSLPAQGKSILLSQGCHRETTCPTTTQNRAVSGHFVLEQSANVYFTLMVRLILRTRGNRSPVGTLKGHNCEVRPIAFSAFTPNITFYTLLKGAGHKPFF